MKRTTFASPILLLALVAGLPRHADAQQPSQAAIQGALQQPGMLEALRTRLQESGMTPEQIRARLRASGYPTTLLDDYLDQNDRNPQRNRTEPTNEELAAISSLGIPIDSTMVAPKVESGNRTVTQPRRSGVFGVDVFRRTTTQFLPLLSGPVPPDYRIGPGDQLVLILTGAVELTHQLSVTREGFVLIPQVGQVFLANLTMDQAKSALRDRLARVYSGVRAGAATRVDFELSVANVRAVQIYVIGEVNQPGAYQVSALATTLTALYTAGGMTERANLRKVTVRRAGKPEATFDLYDYLMRGDVSKDIRLENGDIVHIGMRERRAQVTGKVIRPAIYDLATGETLADLVRDAGGFAPDASQRRISIHRILPGPARISEPMARVAVDVELRGGLVPAVALEDGDSVVVDSLPTAARSYTVSIVGMVEKPGRYPWHEGMTLRDLVNLGRGPAIGADLREAEIARLPDDRSQGQLATTVRVPLDSTFLFQRDSSGRYVGPPGVPFPRSGTASDVPLRPFDNVLILRQPDFELQRVVTILGEVRYPGTYALRSRTERVSDLITRAGGLTPQAYPEGVRFTRLADSVGRINIDLPEVLKNVRSRDNLLLQPEDSVVIPEFQPSVKVEGAVNSPGSVLWRAGKSLSYYIGAAGGLTENGNGSRASVRQANGEIETRGGGFLFIGGSEPKPTAGATVTVPTKIAEPYRDRTGFYAAMASLIASTATIVIALNR